MEMTDRELKVIAALANIGLRRMPGLDTADQPHRHADHIVHKGEKEVCRMLRIVALLNLRARAMPRKSP